MRGSGDSEMLIDNPPLSASSARFVVGQFHSWQDLGTSPVGGPNHSRGRLPADLLGALSDAFPLWSEGPSPLPLIRYA
jgi:hypothetical protein